MVEIELCCPRCLTRFAAPPLAPPDEVHGRMIEEGGWFGLADAPTFEDMIFATVLVRGNVLCGECGSAAHVNETSISPLATTPTPEA